MSAPMDTPRDASPAADYEVLDFHWDTSHGHIVTMLDRRPGRGVVVDLGCGSAPLAEPLRDAGFGYVGLDVNEHCLHALRARGFAAHRLDLRALDELGATLDAAVAAVAAAGSDGELPGDEGGEGRVAAVLALDVIEHLADPTAALHAIATWMQRRDVGALGLSVPNVTHRDLAVKLLGGRWELTATGLLDATHLRFFTDALLDSIVASCGLRELDRMDTTSEWSDQHHPVHTPALHTTTPLGRFLADLRARADEHGATYQFVRLYEAVDVPTVVPPLPVQSPANTPEPRLAVVAGAAPSVGAASDIPAAVPAGVAGDVTAELLADLTAQTSDAWDLTHPDALGECTHVAVVGAGQRLAPHWVEHLLAAGAQWHGMIVRCASASPPDGTGWSPHFDPIEHETAVATPPAALAFPVAAIAALGRRLDDTSAAGVHRLLVELAPFCGVHDTGTAAVTASSPWAGPDAAVIEHDGARPVLVDRGVLAALVDGRRQHAEAHAAAAAVESLAAHNAALTSDNEWLNEELRRLPVRIVRRLLRRPPHR